MVLKCMRPGMKVERFGNKRKYMYKLTENPFIIINPGTQIVPLNEVAQNTILYSRDGEHINTEKRFYITAETLDPYHIVLEIGEDELERCVEYI